MIAIHLRKNILLRTAAAGYLATFILRMVDGFLMVHQWPAAALNYIAWAKTQPQSFPPMELSYFWLVVAGFSGLAAIGVLVENYRSRILFMMAFGVILGCELGVAFMDHVPYLITPYQNFVADIATACAGIVIGISLSDMLS